MTPAEKIASAAAFSNALAAFDREEKGKPPSSSHEGKKRDLRYVLEGLGKAPGPHPSFHTATAAELALLPRRVQGSSDRVGYVSDEKPLEGTLEERLR